MLNLTDLMEEVLALCYGSFLGKLLLLWDRLDWPISIKLCSNSGPITIKVCTEVINMRCLPEFASISQKMSQVGLCSTQCQHSWEISDAAVDGLLLLYILTSPLGDNFMKEIFLRTIIFTFSKNKDHGFNFDDEIKY